MIFWYGSDECSLNRFIDEYFMGFFEQTDKDGNHYSLKMGNKYGGENGKYPKINAAVNVLLYELECIQRVEEYNRIIIHSDFDISTQIHLHRAQQSLGLAVDDYFGIDTYNAICNFIIQNGQR